MWADSDSGLLLKAEVIDEHGDVVEQYAFTQVAVGGDIDRSWIVQDAQVRAATPVAQKRPQPQPVAQPGASGWQVDAMPAGFVKIAEVRRAMHQRAASAIQMVYSDGLAGISVFVEDNDSDEDDHGGLTSQGAIQVYSKVLDGHLVTVVGEVPPQTVIDIADSVRYAGR